MREAILSPEANNAVRKPIAPPSAVRYASLPDPFHLRQGGVLKRAQIAYECWGKLNGERSNAILLFTGLSPSAHAASSPENPEPGWWEKMIGPGRAIDTDSSAISPASGWMHSYPAGELAAP